MWESAKVSNLFKKRLLHFSWLFERNFPKCILVMKINTSLLNFHLRNISVSTNGIIQHFVATSQNTPIIKCNNFVGNFNGGLKIIYCEYSLSLCGGLIIQGGYIWYSCLHPWHNTGYKLYRIQRTITIRHVYEKLLWE